MLDDIVMPLLFLLRIKHFTLPPKERSFNSTVIPIYTAKWEFSAIAKGKSKFPDSIYNSKCFLI